MVATLLYSFLACASILSLEKAAGGRDFEPRPAEPSKANRDHSGPLVAIGGLVPRGSNVFALGMSYFLPRDNDIQYYPKKNHMRTGYWGR